MDRENIDKYELVVVATDSGKPQLTSSATIIIDVLDVDDNQPIFESDRLVYDVPEDLPPNSEIAQVQTLTTEKSPHVIFYRFKLKIRMCLQIISLMRLVMILML